MHNPRGRGVSLLDVVDLAAFDMTTNQWDLSNFVAIGSVDSPDPLSYRMRSDQHHLPGGLPGVERLKSNIMRKKANQKECCRECY